MIYLRCKQSFFKEATMAVPVSSGHKITWTAADDGEVSPFGVTFVNSIKIHGPTAQGTITIQENGTTFFSEVLDPGDFVELAYDRQPMRALSPTAIPAGAIVIVEHS
jgi:hypothetical protein